MPRSKAKDEGFLRSRYPALFKQEGPKPQFLLAPMTIIFLLEGFGFIRSAIPALYAPSTKTPYLVRAHGFVMLFNFCLSAGLLLKFSKNVGLARTHYMEKAKKDGESNCEARYSYPNLYVDGQTPNAKMFNCVQRIHQHALETYPILLILSIVSAIHYPVSTAMCGLLWFFGRKAMADSYVKGDPSKRYEESYLAIGVWISLIMVFFGSLGSIYFVIF